MKNKIYIIDGKTYLSHINDEVHLYGLLHQLAFLAGRIKDEEDVFHVLDAAKRYGEIAEEKFQSWGIPGRYLVFGDRKDLAGLKAAELTPDEAYKTFNMGVGMSIICAPEDQAEVEERLREQGFEPFVMGECGPGEGTVTYR